MYNIVRGYLALLLFSIFKAHFALYLQEMHTKTQKYYKTFFGLKISFWWHFNAVAFCRMAFCRWNFITPQ